MRLGKETEMGLVSPGLEAPRNQCSGTVKLIYRATLYAGNDDAGVMRRWWDASILG